jgi:tetratricopeptide (TPR) repeat protein
MNYSKRGKSCFLKALDAGAEPGITFLSRGTAYLKLKNPDDALADFSRAVEAGRNNPKPYYFRGMAYTNKEDFEKAVADFSTAIELKPVSTIRTWGIIHSHEQTRRRRSGYQERGQL